jgi:mannose-6-phosphate isomerase-like protein (cupin superfamily)
VEKTAGKNLSLKLTILHAGKQTTGQAHDSSEMYFFLDGLGEMEISGKRKRVREKDVVHVEPNEPHRVHNTHESDLVFISLGVISETAK